MPAPARRALAVLAGVPTAAARVATACPSARVRRRRQEAPAAQGWAPETPSAHAVVRQLLHPPLARAVAAPAARRAQRPVRPQRRSEERRVGKECVSKCSARWSTHHSQKKPVKKNHT